MTFQLQNKKTILQQVKMNSFIITADINIPALATSSIGRSNTSAMWPRTEKTTKPQKTLLPQLMSATTTASLNIQNWCMETSNAAI